MQFFLVVLAENDDREIARLTADGQFAIKWSDVLEQAYAAPTAHNGALIAFCRLLLAAKDNFRTKSWADSEREVNHGLPPRICIRALTPPATTDPAYPVLYMSNQTTTLARVNADLTWSVRWAEITALMQLPVQEVCVGALCRVFLAAKDNFVTTPW
jgi:hypothetical protein